MALDGRTEGQTDGRTWTKLEFFSARTAGTVYFAEKNYSEFVQIKCMV